MKMKCIYCNSPEVSMKPALAEGGLVRLPVCRGDEVYVEESFGRPYTMQSLINMQKELV